MANTFGHCGYLNAVFFWQNASDLPVLVFIHGGGFIEGANIQSPGYFLAEQDVVVVSVNYRLGILGTVYVTSLHF